MSAIWTRSIEVNQNEDFSQTFGFATPSSSLQAQLTSATPFSFVGAVGYLQVNATSSPSSTAILTLSSPSSGLSFGTGTVAGISVGTITITIGHLVTLTLPVGEWYYDLLVTQGGTNDYYMNGPFIVNPTVARV